METEEHQEEHHIGGEADREADGDVGQDAEEGAGEEGRHEQEGSAAEDAEVPGPGDDTAILIALVQASMAWRRVYVATAGMLLHQAGGDQDVAAAVLLRRLLERAERRPEMVLAAAATAMTQLAAIHHAINGVNVAEYHRCARAAQTEADPAGTAETEGAAPPARA